MDAIDRRLVRALQRDGRMTNRQLADHVGLSPSPCLRRLKALESAGVIRGYHAEIDPDLYGLPITVFIRVRLERHDEDTVNGFEAKVRANDNIVECHVMTGQADYLLRVMVADLSDYERFVRHDLQRIGGIASIDTSFAYGQVKRRAAFPFVGR
ncbi:Lrp/AsnC family transcriptional regulator [Algimonas porphyrae]|uniref:AsnC family transcriptional regulator n=1 Tax=Algimonas porphyrae TaxID=1128113 RepID=A0ABQ5V4K2_9PROT|nr:Lrp/AsnC family transcriptional regulator [Algimonas porphyrae]GLQ21605.1 AsnC family transcriptional regulator [Algimonas porphyrae]